MKKIVGVIIVLAVIFAVRMRRTTNEVSEIQTAMHEVVMALPCYQGNEQIMDDMFLRGRGKALDASYQMAGRRTASEFDRKAYLDTLFTAMIGYARDLGKKELEECLKTAKEAASKIE